MSLVVFRCAISILKEDEPQNLFAHGGRLLRLRDVLNFLFWKKKFKDSTVLPIRKGDPGSLVLLILVIIPTGSSSQVYTSIHIRFDS